MSSNNGEPEHYGQERLAARAAKYRAEVARLRALAGLTPTADDDHPTTEET